MDVACEDTRSGQLLSSAARVSSPSISTMRTRLPQLLERRAQPGGEQRRGRQHATPAKSHAARKAGRVICIRSVRRHHCAGSSGLPSGRFA